ncbi:Hypothetical predicted protein, partial [Paramuricea clavata]
MKRWKSSVETKYLVLKTNIYVVCKELYESSAPSDKIPERRHNNLFTVNVSDGKIPKALYKTIREKILPYNKLFYFFARLFFAFNFFLLVLVMMLLAQESNISGPAQIMSTIVVSTFPFIFDAIWTEDTFEQKYVNDKEQQQKIRNLIKLEEHEITVGIKKDEEHMAIRNFSDFCSLMMKGTKNRKLQEGRYQGESSENQPLLTNETRILFET